MSDFDHVYQEEVNKIWKLFDKWIKNGFGWMVNSIETFELDICRYKPTKGSSYIELPGWIKKKRAVVNVQNEDDECFKRSVLAALHPGNQNAERLSKYKAFKEDLISPEFPFL